MQEKEVYVIKTLEEMITVSKNKHDALNDKLLKIISEKCSLGELAKPEFQKEVEKLAKYMEKINFAIKVRDKIVGLGTKVRSKEGSEDTMQSSRYFYNDSVNNLFNAFTKRVEFIKKPQKQKKLPIGRMEQVKFIKKKTLSL